VENSSEVSVTYTTGSGGTVQGKGNTLSVGGIAGNMGGTNGAAVMIEKASAVGNIIIGNTKPVYTFDGIETFGLFVGGVTGYMYGAGTGTEQQAKLDDCIYRDGTILLRSNRGSVFVGGAVGKVYDTTAISDSYSVAGNFTINKDGVGDFFIVGGFIGDHRGGSIKNSYSENPVVVNTSSGATGTIYSGGFSGRISSDATNPVEYCYAKGNVSALGYGNMRVGGFTGMSYSNASVSYCYAAGNVSAISRSASNNVFAGGFSGSNYYMSNCYATGDVAADYSGSSATFFVGGLSGQSASTTNVATLENCFATGSVIAQRSDDSAAFNVGGLIGRLENAASIVRNSAALGKSVTATGGTNNPTATPTQNRYVGRVYGNTASGVTITNNYANNGMTVYSDNNYGAAFPKLRWDASGDNKPIVSDRGGNDGGDANLLSVFRDRRFWTNPVPANNTTVFDIKDHGLGFDPAIWDFSTVESKGHPILRGVGGQ
jgi:hypothetical protein